MKHILPALLLTSIVSAFNYTNSTISQDFDELFAFYGGSCQYDGCAEDLAHPVDGLLWTNVQSSFRVTPIDFVHPGGQLPAYADPRSSTKLFLRGLWTGQFINGTKPAVATSRYNGTCVQYWELASLEIGCGISTVNIVEDSTQLIQGPAPCNITIEGFDCNGTCVGHETYAYSATVNSNSFPPYWLEQSYNTTDGGLKGKRVQSVKISADIPYDPATETDPEVGIGRFQYTVFNGTKCG